MTASAKSASAKPMEALLYALARAVLTLIRSLPLDTVARLGRAGGALAYLLDARHRRVAHRNLQACFGHDLTPSALRALVRETFRRIGENFACAAKTAHMSDAELAGRLEMTGPELFLPAPPNPDQTAQGLIVAIGHFGNFELYARIPTRPGHYRRAATYRGLRQPRLDRLLREMRDRSGTVFFERRSDAAALRHALAQGHIALGLLADQHAGDRGLAVPFFGRPCSTSAAPALLALRYRYPLRTAICYRTRLAHWRIEVGPAIPLEHEGQPRTPEAIMADVNQTFEAAIRRDPANWFWVHNRWKKPGRPARRPAPPREP